MNPTFDQLRQELPIAEFLQLCRYLEAGNLKTYRRSVTHVVRRPMGANGGQVGLVKYTPVAGGKYDDPGEIKTTWLDSPLGMKVCTLAKRFIGKQCILFQVNKDASDEQPNGFRELVWIQVVELQSGKN